MTLSSPLGRSPANEKHAKALQLIDDITTDFVSVQEKVLEEILSRSAKTEYLRKFNLNGATDPNTFKSKIPIVSYEDIQPYIQRIANGDKSPLLTGVPISEFFTSSGTTSNGERKFIPMIHEDMDRRVLLSSLVMPVMNLYVADLDKGKSLHFMFVNAESRTPGGILARTGSTSMYKSDHFRNRPYDPYNNYTSPAAAILCLDSFQSMYTQVLCGLIMREEVIRVGTVFAAGVLRAIRFLQLNWREMVHDIRTGTLNSKITDSSVRDCMTGILKPNPELANFVEEEFAEEDWERIIPRIWPNTKYIDAIATGSMAQYVPALEYYSGGLPVVSSIYAASECSFSLNLRPMCKPSEVSYTIMPNMAYFEFLSVESASDYLPSRCLDVTELEVGKEYEIVITTYTGLYRYPLGDILQLTGFHNSAPQFRFVKRRNILLCIESDKTDESELQKAVENASGLLKVFDTRLVDYTSCADTKTVPGHYVIYWELSVKDTTNSPPDNVLDQCCLAMEESLNSIYRQFRSADSSIGPLEIRVVKNGTFEELAEYAITRGASMSQYKVPRCVKSAPILEILDSRVVSMHFSPSLPHWSLDSLTI